MTPASGRFLLDTSILIALFNGDEGIISHMARERKNVFIPVVALGELFFGAAKSGRPVENRERVERFASDKTVIAPDFDVAREYGLIKQELRTKGKPLPENDIWIAAVARARNLVVATRDHHFQQVEGLETVDWVGRPAD